MVIIIIIVKFIGALCKGQTMLKGHLLINVDLGLNKVVLTVGKTSVLVYVRTEG